MRLSKFLFRKREKNKDKKFYTLQYLIAMLKSYEIKHIIASPGTQNAMFNYIVQEDKDFKCYSVVDERSSSYVALGLSTEINEPVVITCTGATASRNYMSAMTEAFYKGIPIIAITFFHPTHNSHSISAQYVDRSISANDIKAISVELPQINTDDDRKKCLTLINVALSTAKYQKKPVHINCPASLVFSKEIIKELPTNIWRNESYSDNFDFVKNEIKSKRTAIFIGSHKKFEKEEEIAISEFAKSYKIPVLCDYTSNYHGENKLLISQLSTILKIEERPELIIDIGNICGEYSFPYLFEKAKIWRISPDNTYKYRNNYPVEKVFTTKEINFFKQLNEETVNYDYYGDLKSKTEKIKIPDLPLSMPLISKYLSSNIPNNSVLYCSILNSLRSMNFYDMDNSIETNSNVGGFGIDGGVSTIIGQSFGNPNKKYFGLIGDLAFFYDMNILGNHHIGNNLRLLIVNNNRGEEFRLNPKLETPLGNKTDELIAAGGHYKQGAKDWACSCNFEYLMANNKEEFIKQINDFCTKEYNKPVLFEVFTTNENEQTAINIMRKYSEKK